MLGKNKKLCFYRIAILQILHNQMVIMLALKRFVTDKEVHEQIEKAAEVTEAVCSASKELQ